MTLWILLSALAPEAMVYNAFVQLRMVMHFRHRMAEVLEKNGDSNTKDKVREESVKAGVEASNTKRYTV